MAGGVLSKAPRNWLAGTRKAMLSGGMPSDPPTVREKHIFGHQTRAHVVRSSDTDARDWLKRAPICLELARHNITHCGIMHASHPMEIVRLKLSGAFFLACFEGQGEVLIDGDWRELGAGFACVQPPFIPNAIRTQRSKHWKFCWVRYQGAPAARPIVSVHAPAVGAFIAAPLRSALEGLRAEVDSASDPHSLRQWTDLVHGYVSGFAQSFRGQDRLQVVWEAVEQSLQKNWTLESLANRARMSKEHLRRLTTSSLGRTPIQHVTYLRMHHAAELLTTTALTIAQVAECIAFASPFAFSDTFLRWTGSRPSDYRKRFQDPQGSDSISLR
ncbi:MAG: AraC-like DNA-binding protein [Candidatus Paceibacteria bacterium]|jgi:AraC-like DNA-binding protein